MIVFFGSLPASCCLWTLLSLQRQFTLPVCFSSSPAQFPFLCHPLFPISFWWRDSPSRVWTEKLVQPWVSKLRASVGDFSPSMPLCVSGITLRYCRYWQNFEAERTREHACAWAREREILMKDYEGESRMEEEEERMREMSKGTRNWWADERGEKGRWSRDRMKNEGDKKKEAKRWGEPQEKRRKRKGRAERQDRWLWAIPETMTWLILFITG